MFDQHRTAACAALPSLLRLLAPFLLRPPTLPFAGNSYRIIDPASYLNVPLRPFPPVLCFAAESVEARETGTFPFQTNPAEVSAAAVVLLWQTAAIGR